MKVSKKRVLIDVGLTFSYLLCIALILFIGYREFTGYVLYLPGEELKVDFDEQIGTVNLRYGTNEKDRFLEFSSSPVIGGYHHDVGTEYIRVWIMNWPIQYGGTTIPYDCQTYDYNRLDQYIQKVLLIDAIPFVVFQHAPNCMTPGGYGDDNIAPRDFNEYTDYVANVTFRYHEVCLNGTFEEEFGVDCNNFYSWYWEVWNEPSNTTFWGEDNNFSIIYNQAYDKIKAISNQIKVGGPAGGATFEQLENWLDNATGYDFVSLHLYDTGNVEDEVTLVRGTKNVYFDDINDYRSLISDYNNIAQIINGEFNLDPVWNPRTNPFIQEDVAAAWYASSLYWMILSQNVSMELFFEGTGDNSTHGFGMWSSLASENYMALPTYRMKKTFKDVNKQGYTIVSSSSTDNMIEILAVKDVNSRYLTIINKYNDTVEDLNLIVEDYETGTLNDLDTNENFIISQEQTTINLNPYQVRFLSLASGVNSGEGGGGGGGASLRTSGNETEENIKQDNESIEKPEENIEGLKKENLPIEGAINEGEIPLITGFAAFIGDFALKDKLIVLLMFLTLAFIIITAYVVRRERKQPPTRIIPPPFYE